MLNRAALQFTFMLEKKIIVVLGGGTCPLCPPMDAPLIGPMLLEMYE